MQDADDLHPLAVPSVDHQMGLTGMNADRLVEFDPLSCAFREIGQQIKQREHPFGTAIRLIDAPFGGTASPDVGKVCFR